ncbi:hypothetical protein EVAR_31081_1 [Eumeta japonica]|uniref:HTH psq-type domain-containing protein n=1 Tax=Eumeta variegata TaxID=151549 RepID=A0A4C1XF04_EUMVA|nr:hypothetical protein EVAR_31081_1 [Eumeta japonica]
MVSQMRQPAGKGAHKKGCFVKESSNSSDKTRKKTDRGSKDLLLYEEVYQEIKNGQSIRAAASMFDLCQVPLLRYKNKKMEDPYSNPTMGYNPATKDFPEEKENK